MDVAMTPDTKFKIGSVSKPFTALLIMQLAEEGLLSPDGTIADYLPDYHGKGKDRITIHHLLSHTSGVLNSLPAEEEAVKERLYHDLEDLLRYSEKAELYFDPGTGFRYSNLGYSMLALIAERVTNTPFHRLLQEKIFTPAGMSDSKQDMDPLVETRLATGYEYDLLKGYENTTFFDNSYAQGAGGVTSTVDDLYSWHQALLSGKLLSKEQQEKMYTASGNGPYGYGWFIREKARGRSGDTLKVIEHTGSVNGFGSYVARVPEDSTMVIVLKNSRSHNYIRPAFAPAIGEQIISIMYDEPAAIPQRSIAMYLARVIGTQGVDRAVDEYHRLKQQDHQEYTFDESELNRLGIELLVQYKRVDDAVRIFEVNMHEFPRSYNTYDSYAYALKERGEYAKSVVYYRKGLEILQEYPGQNSSPSVQNDAAGAAKIISELEEMLSKRK
jgi:CubicO group peptidase (beta-lactamase class C family)